MSILKIIKLESGAFLHNDSIDGDFFLGKFYFKQERNKAFIVETYGAKRRTYLVTEIKVFDFGGTEESFTNFTALENRLTTLGYNGIETNGLIPANIETTANKTDSILGNETSSIKYPSVKAVVDWVTSLFVPKTRTLTIGGVTQDLSADRTFTVSGGTAKRSYYAEWKLNGAMAASTNWYSLGAFNRLDDAFSAIAGLTPTNNFSNCSIQAPCFILPFNAKIKSYNARGFTNGASGATLRSVVNTAFTPVGNQSTIQNALNVADVSFQLNNPSGNAFRFQTDTGLVTSTLPKGTEIRLFNFNNNQNTPLQSTIISIEFEEVL